MSAFECVKYFTVTEKKKNNVYRINTTGVIFENHGFVSQRHVISSYGVALAAYDAEKQGQREMR